MSDVSKTEIGLLIQSNSEIKGQLTETNKLIGTLTEISIRNEERQSHSSEALERLGKRLEKMENRVGILWDKVLKNSLIVNGAVAIVTAVLIWVIKDNI